MTDADVVAGLGKRYVICGAQRRHGGECTRPAGWGTQHVGYGRCKLHGGSTETHVIGAELQRVETEGRRLLAKYHKGPCDDILGTLAALAGEVLAWKELLSDRLAALDESRWRYRTDGGEQTRAEVLLFERAMDRAGKLLVDIAKLKIDERLLKIEEAKLELVGAWLVSILTAAELPNEVEAKILDLVEARWQELES